MMVMCRREEIRSAVSRHHLLQQQTGSPVLDAPETAGRGHRGAKTLVFVLKARLSGKSQTHDGPSCVYMCERERTREGVEEAPEAPEAPSPPFPPPSSLRTPLWPKQHPSML